MKAPSPPRRPAAGDPAHRPAGPAASGGNHPRARAARPGPPLAAGRGPDAVRHGHLLPGLRRWRAAVGLAVRRLGPATGAAGRPVHRPGGHPVRRLGARIRGAAGRALRPGAGTGNLLHHHADHAARPPAGRGTDPLLHHAGRRAVLVAGAGAAGGPAAGGPGGLSRRAGWHRGAGRPAAGSRMGPGRRNTDGAGGAPAHAPAGGPHAARRRTAMHGHAGGRPEPAGLLVLCCRPLHDGAAAVAGVRLDRHGRGAGRHPRRAMEPAPAGPARRVALGLRCVAVGVAAQGLAIWLAPMPGVWWAVAALPIFAGYGLAIPNLLGPALRRYGDCLGRAGALFSLGYYSLLGLLLAATSWLPFGSPVPLALAWAGWPWPWRACIGCAAGCPEFPPRRHARRRVLRRVPPPHWRAPSARDGAQHVDDGVLAALAGMPQGLRPSCPPRPGWSRRTAAPARSPGTSARHHPG